MGSHILEAEKHESNSLSRTHTWLLGELNRRSIRASRGPKSTNPAPTHTHQLPSSKELTKVRLEQLGAQSRIRRGRETRAPMCANTFNDIRATIIKIHVRYMRSWPCKCVICVEHFRCILCHRLLFLRQKHVMLEHVEVNHGERNMQMTTFIFQCCANSSWCSSSDPDWFPACLHWFAQFCRAEKWM